MPRSESKPFMNQVVKRPCPVCSVSEVSTVGPILHPRPALVAGVALELGGTEYWLRECRRCGFQFKDPPIPAERLMECYARATSDNWETDPDPHQRQFDVLRGLLETHASGRRVLDVGCFNGALLGYLGDGWQRYGVEPSQAAAELARRRHVEVLAPSLEELGRDTEPFDAIIATDVVEHIVEPMPFFQQVRDLLAPGGIVLLLTGDSRALAWRLQGGLYWYCSLPEHVSFYSKGTLDWIGDSLGLRGIEYRRLCHKRLPRRQWYTDMAKSAAYIAGRRVRGFGIPSLRRLFVERRGPSIATAQDHLIYMYRKE